MATEKVSAWYHVYNVIVKKIADVLIEIEPHDTFQCRVPIIPE